MNYRHIFHAGNFADVHKHVVLTRILVHLRAKPAAFRVIDTHAGAGRYELAAPEAARGGEWREGIGRLMAAPLPGAAVRALLAPYLAAVAALNPGGGCARYPGSPLIARGLLRPHDRLIACEAEPQAAAVLAASLRGDRRCKALELDGWTALAAYLPPKERRGLVLIDPPFEAPDEFARLPGALAAAHRKWASGIYLLWYPIKDARLSTTLARRLQALGLAKMLRAELAIAPARPAGRLAGSGLIIVNPPHPLAAELQRILPALAAILSPQGSHRLDWLAGEQPQPTSPSP
jgi:23S rRNA (adenine2030-N6)-methyltransferase